MENIKENGKTDGGDCTALRDELKKAIMKLPGSEQYNLLRGYANKYGIKIQRNISEE